jgi:hypothetical protein
MSRVIRACFDEVGVQVYAAFHAETVQAAVRLGTFGPGFSLDRMTWVKPSFGWMLHRSEYATAHRQEAIARVTVTHAGFLEILGQAVLTHHVPSIYPSSADWARELKRSDVRCQWDPDRDLYDRPLDRRAIQLGLSGGVVRKYVHEWIVRVEDATALAHGIRDAKRAGAPLPEVPVERPYLVPAAIVARLGIDEAAT